VNAPSRPSVTPRSCHAPPTRDTTCGGIASSTSFITIAPSMRAGGASSQRTRSRHAGSSRTTSSRWRSRRSGLGSDDRVARRHGARALQRLHEVDREPAAPAPSSTISRACVDSRIAATGGASARANSGVSSGAVVKSPAAPSLRAPADVVAEARRVERERDVVAQAAGIRRARRSRRESRRARARSARARRRPARAATRRARGVVAWKRRLRPRADMLV
jgi:hypothetical protein